MRLEQHDSGRNNSASTEAMWLNMHAEEGGFLYS
jgi:hypothetical protein